MMQPNHRAATPMIVIGGIDRQNILTFFPANLPGPGDTLFTA